MPRRLASGAGLCRVLVPLAIAFPLVAATPAAAQTPAAYLQAVKQAQAILAQAPPGDGAADDSDALAADAVLRAGTGNSQAEILADLEAQPPDLDDARARLRVLQMSLQQPAASTHPAADAASLHGILSQSRYGGIDTSPSVWDQALSWVGQQLARLLLRLLLAGGGLGVPPLLWYAVIALGLLAALAVLALVVRGVWRGPGGEAPAPAGSVARAFTEDQFALADRLAANGNLAGAVRALARAVATELSGQPYWETSALTVRELFSADPRGARLSPLLSPFEAAVYGHRSVDRSTYEHARAAAAPFRTVAAS